MPTGVVLGVRRDGAEVGTAPLEEAGEAEALFAPGEALMESAPMLVDVVMTRTSELELPASSAIEGSTLGGASVTEEVPSAPIGPTSTVVTSDPSVGTRPSWSLVWPGDDPLAWGRNQLHWARRLDPSNSVFTLDDLAEEKDWMSVRLGLEFTVRSLTDMLGG